MQAMNKPHLPVIELLPSRRLAWLLGAAHLGVLLLLATLPVAWWAAAVAAVLLVMSAVLTISRYALRRGVQAATALEFTDRERLKVRTGDGAWHDGRLLGTSTVGPGLAVLNIRLRRTRRAARGHHRGRDGSRRFSPAARLAALGSAAGRHGH